MRDAFSSSLSRVSEFEDLRSLDNLVGRRCTDAPLTTIEQPRALRPFRGWAILLRLAYFTRWNALCAA